MLHCRRDRPDPRHGSSTLRLLLALMLALAPLLVGAQDGAFLPIADGESGAQMPCHTGVDRSTPSADPLPDASCPHCTGDAPASSCQCCDFTAPAGLAAPLQALRTTGPNTSPPRLAASDALPDSPRDGLFRPPIFLS